MKEPAKPHELLAPRPLRSTLFLRTFVPWQIVRFLSINLKMMRMIRMGHKDTSKH